MSEIISIPIIELMEKTERWLLDHDYKKSTIGVYKATWNKFRVFSASPFYDRDTAKKFLFRYGPSGSNVVVGCSHIYSSDGRGMKYKLSKIQDYSFDRKKNPYLSEEEAYRIGLNIKELFYKSFSELPKRVVIHKRTPFRKEEVKGLVESLSSAGVKNIELLEITYEDNLKCFALNERCTQVDGYPVRRGMCFPIDKNTMYLFTHGIAPSVISPKRRYFQGGKSVPLPLKVVKHYGSGDMAQIATEILGLSKMNWNSFGLYGAPPRREQVL